MNFFEYRNYKDLITDLVAQMPKRGRGQYRQLAEKLNVNSTVISQIFRGDRELTPEQALELSDYFGFNNLQEQFFVTLVHKARAGTKKLANYYESEEKLLREKSQQIKSRIQKHTDIKDEHKALFYSDWSYSGIRNLTAIPKYKTVDDIADYFQMNRGLVNQVVDFLLETGLCVQEKGQLKVGPQNTHVGNQSPLVNAHRRNWRLKGLESMQKKSEQDLFYSSPMSLSHEDRLKIREEIVSMIAKVLKRVEKSPEEEVACLNIDWFQF